MTQALGNLRIIAGGPQSLQQMQGIADGAQERLTGDLFTFSAGKVKSAVVNSAARGVDGTFLTDPEHVGVVTGEFGGHPVRIASYKEFPYKNHGKSFVADRSRGLITTGAIVDATAKRGELTALFDGDAARALDDLIIATADDDVDAMRAAATKARGFGIVVNDPRSGVSHLSDEVFGMLDNAKSSLFIATKRYESPVLMEKVKAAEARGVKVTVTKPPKFHGNVVIQDDAAAYFGTAHMTKRSLTGGGSNGRLSRELGVVVRDKDGIAQLRRGLEELDILRPGGAAGAVDAAAGGAAAGGAADFALGGEAMAGAIGNPGGTGIMSHAKWAVPALVGVGALAAGAVWLTHRGGDK
ncbi:MAG: hypothetical protein JWM98_556 [Thermoleophilia bacterium]|nr:hypothetical protein [Thermoleophilia bacterium]